MKLTLKHPGLTNVPAMSETPTLHASERIWINAFLLESLVITGGLFWLLSSPNGMPLYAKIGFVVLTGVCGAAGFACVMRKRQS